MPRNRIARALPEDIGPAMSQSLLNLAAQDCKITDASGNDLTEIIMSHSVEINNAYDKWLEKQRAATADATAKISAEIRRELIRSNQTRESGK